MWLIENISPNQLFIGNHAIEAGQGLYLSILPNRAWQLQKKGLIKIKEVEAVPAHKPSAAPPHPQNDAQLTELLGLVKQLIDSGQISRPQTDVIIQDPQTKIRTIPEAGSFKPSILPESDSIEKIDVKLEESKTKDKKVESSVDKLRRLRSK